MDSKLISIGLWVVMNSRREGSKIFCLTRKFAILCKDTIIKL